MKLDSRYIFIVLSLVSMALAGCVTVPTGSEKLQQQSESMLPPRGAAGVYIFRPTLLGSGALVLWKVKLDSIHFGDLAPRSYLYGIVPPGRHTIGGAVKGSYPATEFHAKEGNNYYFKLSLFSGVIPIKVDEAKRLINEFTLSKYNVFENMKESAFRSSSTSSEKQIVSASHRERIDAYKSGDYSKAYDLSRLFAEQGHVESQVMLSHLYSKGLGVAKDDLKSIEWLALAFESGNKTIRLGFYLQLDNIRQEAEEGNANSQYKLGILYSNGWGVTTDISEAFKWYRKAAKKGHVEAKEMLRATFFAIDRVCTNTKYKITAKAPEGWNVNSTAPGDKTIRGDCRFTKYDAPQAPLISITIDPLRDYMLNYSIEKITRYIMNSAGTVTVIQQPTEVRINNLSASKAIYEMPGVKVILYQFRNKNSVVTAQLIDRISTFKSNMQDFHKVVRSLNFSP